MAQRVLINGTAYDILSGKAMVAGTNYNINKGRTLVGGTGYDVNLNLQTWEKWDLVTTPMACSYYANPTAIYPDNDVYRVYGVSQLCYFATMPTFNDSGSGVVWNGSSTVTNLKSTDFPYTIPADGYYIGQGCNTWDMSYGNGYYQGLWELKAGDILDSFGGSGATSEALILPPTGTTGDIRRTKYEVEKTDTTYSKGSTLIETVTAPEGTYPDEGMSGGYWYVRIS